MKKCFFIIGFGIAAALLATQPLYSQFITSHDPLFMKAVPKPALGGSFTDPVFGTTVTRLTNSVDAGMLGIVPQYSKRQAWNADESLMILLNADNGFFSLYDGKTHAFIRPLDDPAVGGEDVFWHPTQKNTIIFAADSIIMSYDVVTNKTTPVRVFNDYTWINTRGEGNLSNDGKYYAFIGQVYNYTSGETDFRDIVVYDLAANQVVSKMALSHAEGSGQIDWMSVSPLGNYVVVDYSDLETGRYHGVEVYDRNMNFIWQSPVGYGHSDLGLDANGDEIMIVDYYDEAANIYHLRKYKLSNGAITNLLDHSWYFDSHISLRNTDHRGWCYISMFDYTGRLTDDSLSWLPFEDEVFALKTDGSGDVKRIAHHHSRRFSPETPDPDNSVYWAEPHATVNRAGTKVLWGSNWRTNMGDVTSVDTYLCSLTNLSGTGKLSFIHQGDLLISPNPAKEMIFVQTGTRSKPGFLVISNVNGQEVIRQTIQNNKTQIDISALRPGIYIVRAITGNSIATGKLIKE